MRNENEFYYGFEEPAPHHAERRLCMVCSCGHVIEPETGEEFFTEHDGTVTGCEACGVFRLA